METKIVCEKPYNWKYGENIIGEKTHNSKSEASEFGYSARARVSWLVAVLAQQLVWVRYCFFDQLWAIWPPSASAGKLNVEIDPMGKKRRENIEKNRRWKTV